MQPMLTAKAVDSAVVRPHGVPASQAAGANAVFEHTIPSPLGPLRLGATGDGLCLLDFQDPLRIEAAHRGLNRWLGLPTSTSTATKEVKATAKEANTTTRSTSTTTRPASD